MLKNKFKVILAILISIIFASGLSIYATYNYLASDVSYTRDGETISVETALNELYERKSINDIPDTYTIRAASFAGVYNYNSSPIEVINLDLSLFKIIGYTKVKYMIGVSGKSNYKLTLKIDGNTYDSVTSYKDDVWVCSDNKTLEMNNLSNIALSFDRPVIGYGYYQYSFTFSK